MSDCRSPTPSFNVICHRAVRCLRSSARVFALVSSATSGSSCSGFSWTASSARIPVASCSQTASTSWLVERRSSSSAAPTTRRSRNSTSGRKPDSSIRSASCVFAACSRSVDETGNVSARIPAASR